MPDAKRTYTRALRLALYTPLAVGVAGGLIILARRSDLPDPVATSWSGSGVANGFTSVVGTALLAMVLSAGVGGAVAMGAAFVTISVRQRRVMLGLGIGVSVAIAAIFVLLTLGQAGLADPREAVFHPVALIAAGLGGAAAGVLSARLLRDV
jgi:hypothetical protein